MSGTACRCRACFPKRCASRAVTRLASIEPGTLILLTTKVNNNVAAVEPIVPLLPDGVTIVCVQNGLYSEDLVKALVHDRALVLRAITQVGGVLVGPGVVDNTVAGYTLLEDHPQSPAIAAVLTEAGLDGRIIPDIKKEMWRKAVFNCVINPTTSLLACEVGGIVDPRLNSLKQQIIDECLAVARADGVTFEEDFVALIDRVFAGARTIASMRQDLMKGRKTEIDHMNGAVAALGEKYGLAVPGQRGPDDDDSVSGGRRALAPGDNSARFPGLDALRRPFRADRADWGQVKNFAPCPG